MRWSPHGSIPRSDPWLAGRSKRMGNDHRNRKVGRLARRAVQRRCPGHQAPSKRPPSSHSRSREKLNQTTYEWGSRPPTSLMPMTRAPRPPRPTRAPPASAHSTWTSAIEAQPAPDVVKVLTGRWICRCITSQPAKAFSIETRHSSVGELGGKVDEDDAV